MDPVRQIQQFNAGRDSVRLALKYRKMRSSAFAFMRGSCHLFYDRLPAAGVLAWAPPTWACGDLHLENFGSYKGDDRQVYFDINDFDEAALAPASWDLVRLLTSVSLACDALALPTSQTALLCQTLLAAYRTALQAGTARWIERSTAQGRIKDLLDDLDKRPRARFLDARTTLQHKLRRLRTDGSKALPASPAERERVSSFMQAFAQQQAKPEFYRVLDVAQRIAGTGSLGLPRYAILVEGKGSPDGNYLLDLKRAMPSSLAPHLPLAQPAWPDEATRVVTLQRRIQAVSMAFLHAVQLDGEPFVLRALQPVEDRVSLGPAHAATAQLQDLVASLGQLLAWAQLRSAGRAGSANADELVAFAQSASWDADLLEAVEHGARQTRADAASFNAAYDAGELDTDADLTDGAPGHGQTTRT